MPAIKFVVVVVVVVEEILSMVEGISSSKGNMEDDIGCDEE